MSDSGKKDLPFEMHLTFDGIYAKVVRQFANVDNGWSYSEIKGDPAYGKNDEVVRCYLTAYDLDYRKATSRLLKATTDVTVPVSRAKIEFIVMDTKYDHDRSHNISGYGL